MGNTADGGDVSRHREVTVEDDFEAAAVRSAIKLYFMHMLTGRCSH